MAEIARSGGVVNESSLTSELLRENAPLLARRKELAGEYTTANQNYQKATAEFKNSQAQSVKEAQLGLAERKATTQEEQFAQRQTQQEQQFEQKLQQSGMKVQKVNTYDAYGNVNGQAIKILNLNGTTTQGVDKISSSGTYTSNSGSKIDSSVKGTPSQPSTTYLSSPEYVKSFAGNSDKDTPQNTNLTIPGTTETAGTLYQNAMIWAFENGKLPTGVGRTNRAISIDTAKAIKQKGTAILNSLGIDSIQASLAYKSFGSALTKLTGNYGQLLSNEGTADRNFKLLISLGQKVKDTSYSNPVPLINEWVRSGQINVQGSKEVNDYVAQLKLTLNEFAKVISGQTGGAAVSDSARNEVAGLLGKGQNIDTVQSLYNNVVVPDLANRKAGAQEAINTLMSGATGGVSDKNKVTDPDDITSPTNITYTFGSVVGNDGYVSPTDWNNVKSLYTQHGGNSDEFESKFGNFKNPTNKNY